MQVHCRAHDVQNCPGTLRQGVHERRRVRQRRLFNVDPRRQVARLATVVLRVSGGLDHNTLPHAGPGAAFWRGHGCGQQDGHRPTQAQLRQHVPGRVGEHADQREPAVPRARRRLRRRLLQGCKRGWLVPVRYCCLGRRRRHVRGQGATGRGRATLKIAAGCRASLGLQGGEGGKCGVHHVYDDRLQRAKGRARVHAWDQQRTKGLWNGHHL